MMLRSTIARQSVAYKSNIGANLNYRICKNAKEEIRYNDIILEVCALAVTLELFFLFFFLYLLNDEEPEKKVRNHTREV